MKHVRISAVLAIGLTAALIATGGLGSAQSQSSPQEFALIHSLTVSADGEFGAPAIFPNEIRVKLGQPIRLFNVSPDPSGLLHDPVVISSDEAGNSPVFGVTGFLVEPGKVTVVEFTPNRAGTFFITHKKHFHDVVGTLVVEE